MTVSVLIITTCFGTLCNVDPVGHGGLGRFFKMDPAGLANICVILSVLLSAVGKLQFFESESDIFLFYEKTLDDTSSLYLFYIQNYLFFAQSLKFVRFRQNFWKSPDIGQNREVGLD